MTMSEKEREEIATLGGGCFWCLEAVYEEVEGVRSVVSGYAGGHDERPTYERVCAGTTGHAEVVRVTFDPEAVSYREILEIFFAIHDPTTLNRQGADVGTQYRSVIFQHSPEQHRTAQNIISEMERDGVWDAPIVTEVQPTPEFHEAEKYHQSYFRRNPNQGYCQFVVAPKLDKFRRTFAQKRKRDAT
jgi:peptide-methionine (S)-S-oxide reductase